MPKKYKYWDVDFEEAKSCLINFIKIDDLDKQMEALQTKVNELEKETSLNKDKRNQAKDDKERTQFTNDYIVSNRNYHEAKAELSYIIEQDNVFRRNKNKSFKVVRLKDRYSRKENVSVIVMDKGIDDCKIISTTNSIGENIYRLEEYGIYLTPPYLDELAKIIREVFFDLEVQEQDFIENEVPMGAIEKFVSMCYEQIKEEEETYKDASGAYYDIPVRTIKDWYENSIFKRFSLTSIKEALIIYGYAKCNTGRNDYTINNRKIIRLYSAEVQKVCQNEK